MMMMTQDMLPVPYFISALRAGLPLGALGAMATLQPWGRSSSEFGDDAIKLVHTKKILLPAANAQGTIMV